MENLLSLATLASCGVQKKVICGSSWKRSSVNSFHAVLTNRVKIDGMIPKGNCPTHKNMFLVYLKLSSLSGFFVSMTERFFVPTEETCGAHSRNTQTGFSYLLNMSIVVTNFYITLKISSYNQ